MNCDDCGVQFWWPLDRPSAGWYALHGSTTADWGDSLVRPGHRQFLARPPLRSGRLLDIGCGHGLFLKRVRDELGLDVWGLDWDTAAVEFGRRVRKLEHLHAEPLEEFAMAVRSGRFDAITLFEVLEHQANPVTFLRRALGLLKPGGVVAGSVPNRNRLVVGLREEWDYPPQHLFWFHSGSLERLLREAGLERVRMRPLLDAAVLVNQIMDRFSLGIASRMVRMPDPMTRTVVDLSSAEWEHLRTQPKPVGYRVTTALKKLVLSPVLLPILVGAALVPSVRHTLYFEARWPVEPVSG